MPIMFPPQPTPVEERPYKYTVVKEFVDLERLVWEKNPKSVLELQRRARESNRRHGLGIEQEKNLRSEDVKFVVRTNDNYLQPDVRPLPCQGGHQMALEDLINRNGGKECCRLVYITRHAESDHNVKADELGKTESFAAADHFHADRDPSLSVRGVEQAKELGYRILDSEASRFGLPDKVHCSPLWRCVQTAAYSGGNYHFSVDVKLNDDWREWKGPGQLHVSDARSCQDTMRRKVRSLEGELVGAEVMVDTVDGFTELDEAFFEPETFVNVDIRLERALEKVFQDGNLCQHIVTHGRTSQSLMRLLGFERFGDGPEEYRVWDFENAATVVLLVKREPRGDKVQQLQRDISLQQKELSYINSKYELDINDGFAGIQQIVAQDPAMRAIWMEKLDALRKEMQVNNAVAWRYDLLAKAVQGTFQYGEFRVHSE
ncbi:histidine phosphatase superfamily [Plectosphaerella plurivora]|uniref:Histidine phosphatase superfamily n=1 Tax=Plectosphaerella plurivora TaxID=936078 RepID=A0A9P8V9I9_9PEZI|nr:histidine phosphatase superfamily [Plectosphaerella plurivora]